VHRSAAPRGLALDIEEDVEHLTLVIAASEEIDRVDR
jgi:hypothetical protein